MSVGARMRSGHRNIRCGEDKDAREEKVRATQSSPAGPCNMNMHGEAWPGWNAGESDVGRLK